jgi:acyl-CoA thioester hydrolase
MPRLKINFVSPVIYSTSLSVRLADINYGGHVGNDRFVGFLQEARMSWLNALGYTSELDIEGVGWIQSDLCVQYLAQSYHNDEIKIELSIGDISRAGFELKYRLSNQIGKPVTLAVSTLLFFDYQRQKVVSIPSAFLALLKNACLYE